MSITPEQLASSGTEHGAQAAIFCWAAQNYELYPELRNLFAIPNGGFRNKATAGRLKAEGVKSGVSDMFLPVPVKQYHGMFLELKIKPNQLTKEQEAFGKNVLSLGYFFAVCYSWKEATAQLVKYICL